MPKNNAYRISTMKTIVPRIENGSGKPYVKSFIEKSQRLLNTVEALRAMDEKPNPNESETGHATRLADFASKLHELTSFYEERFLSMEKEFKAEVDEKVAAKVKLQPNEYAAELRTLMRSLPHGERIKELDRMVKSNDASGIAAVCCSPSILSGLSPEIQNDYKNLMLTAHAKAEMAELAEFREVLSTAFTCTKVARDFAADYAVSLNRERLAAIERGKADAAASQVAFNVAVAAE